jgi:hypothetical protein
MMFFVISKVADGAAGAGVGRTSASLRGEGVPQYAHHAFLLIGLTICGRAHMGKIRSTKKQYLSRASFFGGFSRIGQKKILMWARPQMVKQMSQNSRNPCCSL